MSHERQQRPCETGSEQAHRRRRQHVEREMHAEGDPRPPGQQARQAGRRAPAPGRAGQRQAQAEAPRQGRVVAGEAVIRDVGEPGVPDADHERPRLEPGRAEQEVGALSGQQPRAGGDQRGAALGTSPHPKRGEQRRRQRHRGVGEQFEHAQPCGARLGGQVERQEQGRVPGQHRGPATAKRCACHRAEPDIGDPYSGGQAAPRLIRRCCPPTRRGRTDRWRRRPTHRCAAC